MPTARERLFAYRQIYDLAGTDALFTQAVRENLAHHIAGCSFYRDLLASRGFDPASLQTAADCARIPVVPASFFKYHTAVSLPMGDMAVHATSSGTQGQKSQMWFDQQSIDDGIRMVTSVVKHYRFFSLQPTNYLMLGYQPAPGNETGAISTAMGMTRFAPFALHREFALKHTAHGYEVNRFGVLEAVRRYARQGWPVRMIGFPYYLYLLLQTMKEEGMKPLKLNKRSYVLLGGGWKQFDDTAIDKLELYAMAEEMLGIPQQNCRDFFAAVEHSVAYVECAHHHLHVPVWGRVFIRDVRTLQPLGFDKPGFLSFVTPLVRSAPITSVMMGDLAVLRDGSGCPCGAGSPYFEVLGRAGTSKMRSCAVAASEFTAGGGRHG